MLLEELQHELLRLDASASSTGYQTRFTYKLVHQVI